MGLTGRTCWSSTKLEMQGAAEREIAAVSQRRDDESTVVPQIFVAVLKLGVDNADLQVLTHPVISGGRPGGRGREREGGSDEGEKWRGIWKEEREFLGWKRGGGAKPIL